MDKKKVIIIGGGASGFYTAIRLAELNEEFDITILEKSTKPLNKVRISGGGRCNVTHACFEPKSLVTSYPRGKRELLGPFHHHQPGDIIDWFLEKGVELKTEEDGRMFPVSNSSETIVNTFINAADNLGVKLITGKAVTSVKQNEHTWSVLTNSEQWDADHLIVSAGSSKLIWQMIMDIGHKIIEPVPSLFTFKIDDDSIHRLAGISLDKVHVIIPSLKKSEEGILLFTHWGISAPAVLKLSSKCARELAELGYKFKIVLDFATHMTEQELDEELMTLTKVSNKLVINQPLINYPKRFWAYLCERSEISNLTKWPELTKGARKALISNIKFSEHSVNGKTTFKEEFVTAGGIDLREVNFKTMESKLFENLYFTGEVLNIDAYTGGFNFQAAWTSGYLAASSISKKV